jgi:hypothetical protein
MLCTLHTACDTATPRPVNHAVLMTRIAAAERALSEQEASQQRDELRRNCDFSVVLDCLEVFEEELELAEQPTIASLEEELVSSTGADEGLLRNIHEVRVHMHGFPPELVHNMHAYHLVQRPRSAQQGKSYFRVLLAAYRAAIPLLQRLLVGIKPGSRIKAGSWQAFAARRLVEYFDLDPQDNPMADAERGEEALAYAQLTAQQRCASTAQKWLCT